MSPTPPSAVVANVRNQIIVCRRCPLYKQQATSPVPFNGPVMAEVAVLGEAPGYTEEREGVPFVGKAGVFLRDAMREVGINPNECFYFNAVCCNPGKSPENLHIEACKPNFYAQLSIIRASYVLVLGNVALHQFRPDLTITQARGKAMRRDGRILFPTFHPAAALRQQNYARQLRDDLWKFKVIMAKERVHGSK